MSKTILCNLFICGCAILTSIFSSCTSKPTTDNQWELLLDKDLSKWGIYQSYEIKNGYNGSIPTDANGNAIQPIGYNKNYKEVFTVTGIDNPVLRISGEVYGCVFTKNSYRNYHLKLKQKWGEQKWEPRLDKNLDSGILYHSQGESGVDYWRSWMLSHEFQLIRSGEEGVSGDYWCIGNSRMTVRARKEGNKTVFDPEAAPISMGAGTPNGYCLAIEPEERMWNEIELICYEGKSIHIVNGKVVMALSGLSYLDGNTVKPLDEGKIQLQSEAGEVFFKDIQIKSILSLPNEYISYFR